LRIAFVSHLDIRDCGRRVGGSAKFGAKFAARPGSNSAGASGTGSEKASADQRIGKTSDKARRSQ
jgi:hypothetical protein